MAVKIRLARAGSKKRPFYRVVAADERAPRDGKFLEKIGTYNPMLPKDHPERIVLKKERVQYWLGTGAQPTDRVALFLGQVGIIEAPKYQETPKKSTPKAKAQERMRLAKEAEENAKAEAEEAAKAALEAQNQPVEEASAAEEPSA